MRREREVFPCQMFHILPRDRPCRPKPLETVHDDHLFLKLEFRRTNYNQKRWIASVSLRLYRLETI